MTRTGLESVRPMTMAVLLLAAAPFAHADATRAAIEAVGAEWSAAAGRGDAKAVAALYTADGQLLPEGSDAVKGTAAIQKYVQGVLDSGVGGVKLKTLEVYGHGAMADEVGEYEMLDKAGKSIDHGKYVVVWRRDGGHWKLHRDIFTSSVPPKK